VHISSLPISPESSASPGRVTASADTASGWAPEAWITKTSSFPPGRGGALAGLSFAAKDNIDVAGEPTTAACPAFAYTPMAHAAVVQKLLDAGAQLLGKTNLDQFACGLNGTRSPYGAVPNAINPAYISGGSSSGSAYVVATGQADFALGTDTAGSGRVPAGLNNIVGLKPSKGLFARTVATAARVLEAAMGYDPLDPYSRVLVMAGSTLPKGFRFGVPSALNFYGDALAEQAFGEAVLRMEALGGVPVSINFAPLAEAAALLYESALVAERYTAVRDFFDAHEEEVIEPVRSIIGAGKQYSAADLYAAQTKLRALGQQAAAMWQDIDVLLLPTAPTHYTLQAMQRDPVVLNRHLGTYTNFVNLLDYAALSVPSSLRPDGLPFGITLVGLAGSDWQLAELGQRYHHATGLPQGALEEALPAPVALPGIQPATTVRLAVVGAHLSGMPLNSQLTTRGATLVGPAHTAPDYRFYALPGTVPPKPGLLRVAANEGAGIALEIWEMPVQHYGSFVALIPAPLGIGTLALEDGSSVQGFVCEAHALQGAEDITHLGGWRAYLASRSSTPA
jgi:allophanate hydrolase